MTVRVKAPDGTVINFPDDTPESTILDVMRREYGGPQQASEPTTFAPGEPILPGPFRAPPSEITPTGEQRIRDVSTAEDMARSFATGLRQSMAAIPGIPGTIEQLGRAGINVVSQRLRGTDAVSPETFLPTSADRVRQEAQSTRFGEPVPFYQPQTTAGRYAETVGAFAPGAIMPGTAVQRALLNTTLPAVASEAAGQATEGTAAETPSRVAAALLTPYAPRAAMRAVTPFPAPADRTAQAALLAREGVDLTAGQRTGSRPLRWAESNARDMPFSGGRIAEVMDRQGAQLTRAALRRVGENAPDVTATPNVLANARNRIGAEFDRITQHPLPLNAANRNAIATRLGNAFRTYLDTVPNAAQRPFVESFMNDVLDAMTTPSGRGYRASIPGETIQHWRSRLSRMANETNDPEFAAFLNGARNTLDDIYGASLPAGEAAAWMRARQQWRQLLILEDAVAGSAMGTPYGTVSPASLRRAARTGDPQAFAEGRAPFADLAHAAGATMDALPNSGTPARLAVGWGIPGAMAGGVADALTGTPGAGTLSGAAATSLIGPAIQARIVSNPTMQEILGNQLLAAPLNALGPTRPGMVARALLLPAQMPATLGGY